jgi:hypothetical protein
MAMFNQRGREESPKGIVRLEVAVAGPVSKLDAQQPTATDILWLFFWVD